MAGKNAKTLMEKVRAGTLPQVVRTVAKQESMAPEILAQGIAEGLIVIPQNRLRKLAEPRGIGVGLRTKVNANIGTSPDFPSLKDELKKLKVSLEAGADAVMDLSTGGDLVKIRKKIISLCPRPLGTVPIYQAIRELLDQGGKVPDLTVDMIFKVIEGQAKEGVDFMTLHCGIRLDTIKSMRGARVADIVSRGGAFLAAWMSFHDRENPLYEHFDRLVDIARAYDITLSLGDGLRPGAIFDATDRAQISELVTLGELTDYAWSRGVQVMIEGPGHVPLDQIETNIKLQKRLCKGAPFYVLGPVVTDVAPGYDHVTAAIGGAVAAAAGADFLCYVTPSEHLGLPDVAAVREGVITARIAAHTADIVKGIPGAAEWDLAMSKARKALDWDKQKQLAMDPTKFAVREQRKPHDKELCSMCGEFCAMKVASEFLR